MSKVSNNSIVMSSELQRSFPRTSSGRPSELTSNVEDLTENALMLKVLRGLRQSPISREDFIQYLDKERSGELGRFFVEAEKHEHVAAEKAPEAVNLAQYIADHYIKMDAEEEINLSDTDRKRILNNIEENPSDAGMDPRLFKTAKGEVIKMLSGDKFQRFLKRQLETNISDREAKRRAIVSIILFVVSAIIIGLLMWIQTFAASPFDSRGWRAIVLPLVFWACGLSFSSQARVCQGLAGRCVKMKEDDSWFVAFARGRGIQQVKDDIARGRIVEKAKQITYKTFIATTVIMIIILVVPPGYGIGAPG